MGRTQAERAVGLVAAVAGSAFAATACGERPAGDGDALLADSAYVQVVARLQLIATPADTARQREADSARAQVLADHGVTPEQLIAFAEVAGQDPGRSRAIWEAIGVLVDSIREADRPDLDEAGVDRDGALSIRASEQSAADPDAADDPGAEDDDPAAAAARPRVDSPQAIRRDTAGKPRAGQPVRRP